MLANTNRPPSIPSHPGPPHYYTPRSPPQAAQSRPDIVAPNQQMYSRDPSGGPSNAQQLPSLRTLLEPELLDSKSSEASSRTGGILFYEVRPQHGTSSPTLKRRQNFDLSHHGYQENTATVSRTPYLHRQTLSTSHVDTQTASPSTPGSALHPLGVGTERRATIAYNSHHDLVGQIFQPITRESDMTGVVPGFPGLDDLSDMGRSMRRRLDGTSRAPIRSSRCIGRQEIAGEGSCYVYEDGTYCRAVIDGEPVNPSWGITKAGKPRKRLAQACLTCREKKIKCEPGFPKCHQCTKSQRVCRGGVNQANASNATGENSPPSPAPVYKKRSVEVLGPAVGFDRNSISGESQEAFKKSDPYNAGSHVKVRPLQGASTAAASRDMSVQSVGSDWSSSTHEHGSEDHRRSIQHEQMALQLAQDPYENDPYLTLRLLDLYFARAGSATCGILPRRYFLAWVESERRKTQDQLMLLYSVLAIGSLFSATADHDVVGKRFAAVACYAAEKRIGRFSLQLCQTRLMLALYHYAKGNFQEAWDYCGAGMRAMGALNLNTEEGIKDLADRSMDLAFRFDRRTFEECCRRTFWSGLLMDRYNGFSGEHMLLSNVDDAYVRLPCPDNLFEDSQPGEMPFLEELLSERSPHTQLGDMAYMCTISALSYEVLAFTTRASRRLDKDCAEQYEIFYTKICAKLEAWHNLLPNSLRYSGANISSSITGGYSRAFLSIHALYHATLIRLNRHVRIQLLTATKARRNIEECMRHASNFLSMIHSLATINRQQRLAPNFASEFLFSTPFPGYTLLLAIDVLTSAGSYSHLPGLIETVRISTSCMEELSVFWASARTQQLAISSRLRQITDIQEGQPVMKSTCGHFWRINDSLELAFGRDDAMYKADDPLLFDVVAQLSRR